RFKAGQLACGLDRIDVGDAIGQRQIHEVEDRPERLGGGLAAQAQHERYAAQQATVPCMESPELCVERAQGVYAGGAQDERGTGVVLAVNLYVQATKKTAGMLGSLRKLAVVRAAAFDFLNAA